MTFTELTDQLYSLSVASPMGRFNAVPESNKAWIKSYLYTIFVRSGSNTDKAIIQISLPDGQWYCKITKFAEGQYDYYIPETREQNARIWDEFTGRKPQEPATKKDYVEPLLYFV